MSPIELRREFEAANLRRLDEERRDVALAWYVAAFSRQDKLKPLATAMQPFDQAEGVVAKSKYRQTRAEQLAALAAISAQSGIPLRIVEQKKVN